jgi:hypothetical protein
MARLLSTDAIVGSRSVGAIGTATEESSGRGSCAPARLSFPERWGRSLGRYVPGLS